MPSEKLSAQQAATLKKKTAKVFVLYNNGRHFAARHDGGRLVFDERHGLDWLQNLMQTEGFNLLYTSNAPKSRRPSRAWVISKPRWQSAAARR